MKTNVKRGIVSGAVALSLLGGSAAGVAADQHQSVHTAGVFAQQEANVGQLVSGLITVNVGAIQADIDVGDVTLVNVEDVLNDSEIRILNNVLNNNEIASRNQNFLNNLLRDADIITENQVVVGVLSGGQIVVDDVA